jgi:hypothetical protein
MKQGKKREANTGEQAQANPVCATNHFLRTSQARMQAAWGVSLLSIP